MQILKLLALFIFLPALAFAQHWRVELSGGAVIPTDLNPRKAVPSTQSPYVTHAPMTLPSDVGVVSAIGGLKLMRRDSSIEYGLGASVFPIRFSAVTAVDTGGPDRRFIATHQEAYLARPAVPVRAFFNYCHHRSRAHAFIGLSAGLVFVQGKTMQDVNTLRNYEDFTVYFHNAVGYTIGGQLGFRRSFGAFDAGGELAANFMHLSLKQGTSNTAYSYNIFYFPLQVYVGYSF